MDVPDGGIACELNERQAVYLGDSDEASHYVLAPWDDCVLPEPCEIRQRFGMSFSVTLMFVVDVSGSMNDLVSGTNTTPWETTRSELRRAFEQLPEPTAVGVLYYPNLPAPGPEGSTEPVDDPSSCVNLDAIVMPELRTESHRARLLDSLDRVEVGGASPTPSAYRAAFDVLKSTQLPGDKYLVLVTDGEPTLGAGCIGTGHENPDAVESAYVSSTLDLIQAAWTVRPPEPRIGTFVIGVPGSTQYFTGEEADPWMLEAADLGGTGPLDCTFEGKNDCFIDLSDPSVELGPDLSTALRHLLGLNAHCDFVPSASAQDGDLGGLGSVAVKLRDARGDEFFLPRVSEEDCTKIGAGWFWNADRSALSLCDDLCIVPNTFSIVDVEVRYACREANGL